MTFYQYLKTKKDDELKEIYESPIPKWFPTHLKRIDEKRKSQAYRILRQRVLIKNKLR